MVVGNRRATASILLVYIAVAAVSSAVTYLCVIGIVTSRSQQASTQLQCELIRWDLEANALWMVIRNNGGVTVTITALGVRQDTMGSAFDAVQTSTIIERMATGEIDWTGTTLTLSPQTTYVLQVTCSNGFQYEITSTTPPVTYIAITNLDSDPHNRGTVKVL